MTVNWHDISYLLSGTVRQRKAYHVLKELDILTILRHFNPILVGTIPLDIYTDESDLDIICEVRDFAAFDLCINSAFSFFSGFRIERKDFRNIPSIIARFNYSTFCIEIFGQRHPVTEQYAYRHMIVESRLLSLGGKEANQKIRRLKRSGLKTEPAFALYFRLEGDPFEILLQMWDLSEKELKDYIDKKS